MRRLLNLINALATGNVYHPVQIDAQEKVSHARQMYLSTSPFDHAVILRGSFQALRVNYRHTNGVLLLWKKKDTPQLFLRHHPKDLSNLIASQWSAIFFCNTVGSVPSNPDDNTTIDNSTNNDPPPGLPPQPDNDQDMNDNPEQYNTPPSSPPQPPDQPMPDDPHTPTNNRPPDNDGDPFHTPFQSPPRPNDDPDEDMHSPQDEPEIPLQPSQPPGFPPTPFPGSNAIPVSPDTALIVPNTIIPPNIEDTPMTHSTKRPPDDPLAPPATKARPSRQMPASSSSQFQPSNHLGGDTQPSVTPHATPKPATVAPSVSNAQNAVTPHVTPQPATVAPSVSNAQNAPKTMTSRSRCRSIRT